MQLSPTSLRCRERKMAALPDGSDLYRELEQLVEAQDREVYAKRLRMAVKGVRGWVPGDAGVPPFHSDELDAWVGRMGAEEAYREHRAHTAV